MPMEGDTSLDALLLPFGLVKPDEMKSLCVTAQLGGGMSSFCAAVRSCLMSFASSSPFPLASRVLSSYCSLSLILQTPFEHPERKKREAPWFLSRAGPGRFLSSYVIYQRDSIGNALDRYIQQTQRYASPGLSNRRFGGEKKR